MSLEFIELATLRIGLGLANNFYIFLSYCVVFKIDEREEGKEGKGGGVGGERRERERFVALLIYAFTGCFLYVH